MKKLRAKLGMGLLFSALVLTTGCGEKAIQLTDEEEGLAWITAHVVSKFNTRQPDGLVYVDTAGRGRERRTGQNRGQKKRRQNRMLFRRWNRMTDRRRRRHSRFP